jgi:CubicO group peptidase (beta-lactamase class C family)
MYGKASQPEGLAISGTVEPGFEGVREAFAENFARRNELGGACCIYYHGEKVVDLWGGVRNRATGEPWQEDTMVIVFSTTKGLSGLALALAVSRKWLGYDECVSAYWPQFAQQGKEKVTVHQLLSHQAGLPALDAPVNKMTLADPDRLAAALAVQRPAWEPGKRQGYHALSLGFYESELLRRVDPRHRTLGRFFQDEIAAPLGLDFYIGLPEQIPNARLATIQSYNPILLLLHPNAFVRAFLNPRSLTHRAFWRNPGMAVIFDRASIYSRCLEVPAQGGVGTARAIAHAYSVLAMGGGRLGLREETLQQLMAPAVPPTEGFYDEVLKREWSLSLGFAKPSPGFAYASPSAFGTPGSGGSFGFADPETRVGYAYVTNRMGRQQGGDPRELALRDALHRAIGTPAGRG